MRARKRGGEERENAYRRTNEGEIIALSTLRSQRGPKRNVKERTAAQLSDVAVPIPIKRDRRRQRRAKKSG